MRAMALINKCRCAIFADVIRYRGAALAIAGFGAFQLIGSTFGFGMPCAFYEVCHKPCPGCGLTRSVLSLLHGHVGDSLTFHPFGPLLLAGLVAALVAGILPANPRTFFVGKVAAVERATGLTALILTLLMLTWVLRLCGLLPLKVL
jgi:hypothetical protein